MCIGYICVEVILIVWLWSGWVGVGVVMWFLWWIFFEFNYEVVFIVFKYVINLFFCEIVISCLF